jgi:hypothetical protein
MQSSKFICHPLNISIIMGDRYKNVKDWLLRGLDKWKPNVQNDIFAGCTLYLRENELYVGVKSFNTGTGTGQSY